MRYISAPQRSHIVGSSGELVGGAFKAEMTGVKMSLGLGVEASDTKLIIGCWLRVGWPD